MAEHTTAKLAAALSAVPGVPREMIQRAADGWYHDYLSPLDFPEIQLYQELRELAALPATPRGSRSLLRELALRITRGDFDASPEEADAWAASADGQETFRALAEDVTFGGIVRDLVVHNPVNDWCCCEPNGDERCEYRMLADTVGDLFNPPDKDEAEVSILMDAVTAIAEFVRSLPCTCRPNPPEYADSTVPDGPDVVCGRCRVLGQWRGKHLDRRSGQSR